MGHIRLLRALTILAALLALAAAARPTQAATATTYTVTDLGDLGGGLSFAFGINNRGQVVGESYTAVPDPSAPPHVPPYTEFHAFIWQNGSLRDLGTDGTSPDSVAIGLNDLGQVAGAAYDYYYTLRALLWESGSFTALPTLDGPHANAYTVNPSAQVTGWANLNLADPSGGSDNGYQLHAVIWSPHSKVQNLGTLGGLDSVAGTGNAINVHGHVAGFSQYNTTYNPLVQQYNYHAFFWNGSQMLDLGAFGKQTNDSISQGEAVNNQDQVVGLSYTDVADTCFGGPQNWGFVWQKGSMQPLYPLSGDCDAVAFAINNRGQTVGVSASGTPSAPIYRAVIWRDATAVDLNTLIPAKSGWSLLFAEGINDQGQIVGFGTNPAGKTHGFLLTPTRSKASLTTRAIPSPLTQQQIEAIPLRLLHSGDFGKLGGPVKI